MTQITDLTIRRGTVEDADLLSELGARTFAETFAADNTSEDLTAYIATSFSVAQLTAELKHPASTFLIAEVDGRARLLLPPSIAELCKNETTEAKSWNVSK